MTMPNAYRLVRSSIYICEQLGMSPLAARLAVRKIATEAVLQLDDKDAPENGWLHEVLAAATRQYEMCHHRTYRSAKPTADASAPNAAGQSPP